MTVDTWYSKSKSTQFSFHIFLGAKFWHLYRVSASVCGSSLVTRKHRWENMGDSLTFLLKKNPFYRPDRISIAVLKTGAQNSTTQIGKWTRCQQLIINNSVKIMDISSWKCSPLFWLLLMFAGGLLFWSWLPILIWQLENNIQHNKLKQNEVNIIRNAINNFLNIMFKLNLAKLSRFSGLEFTTTYQPMLQQSQWWFDLL